MVGVRAAAAKKAKFNWILTKKPAIPMVCGLSVSIMGHFGAYWGQFGAWSGGVDQGPRPPGRWWLSRVFYKWRCRFPRG